MELESVYRYMYSTLLMVLTNILTATGKDRNADPERNLSYNVVTSLSSDLSGHVTVSFVTTFTVAQHYLLT